MGNDGGSIPTRRELVKEAARNRTSTEIKESQHEQQEYHWTTDPVSHQPLSQPVVSDCNGRLYNKDIILEFLVEGQRAEDVEKVTLGSIKSLRDIVEVKFEVDVEATKQANGSARREQWKCPVTGDGLGPSSKAVYLVPCGHAFSGAAVKEVSGERCLVCDQQYATNDIIPILATSPEDIARLSLRSRTLQEKGLTHSLKKVQGSSKKRKKKDELAETLYEAETSAKTGEKPKDGTPRASTPLNTEKANNNINNASTASLTAKVLEEQERVKKRKMENENVRSLFMSRDQSKPMGKNNDFMTRGYSVPNGSKG
ncbi:DUF602 domain-containing protein [Polychaeton citri CBS 116435]|uniref:DUF602 domain-containing protein n=1 Tax=Polychaeton citri CBS 116435 TaxID=1314669 RepID=A0A9P4UNG6_9PEZI|nr:DUF602 domain-containing protein [Polychaeton citri CBS 116435]